MILIAPTILALMGATPNVVRAQVDNNDTWYQQGYSFGLSHGNLVYQTGCPGIGNDNNKTQIASFCLGFEAGQLQVAKNTIHTLDLNRFGRMVFHLKMPSIYRSIPDVSISTPPTTASMPNDGRI
jgi:hypothetical protein